MGFFNEIRKLLFSVKSVSKSSSDQLIEKGKKAGSEIREKGSAMAEKIKDHVENMGEDVIDFTEKIGEEVIEKGSRFGEKVKDVAEDVGSRVLGKDVDPSDSDEDKGKMRAEDLFEADFDEESPMADAVDEDDTYDEEMDEFVPEQGPKPPESGKEPGLIDQAKAAVDKVGKELDEAVNKIQDLEKEEMIRKPLSDSLKKDSLAEKDDFFRKAQDFAEGRYSSMRPPEIRKSETDKEKSKDPVPGFEDMDGDGDEIIDDALIISEEE